jgi:hypothetical protein
VGHRRGERREGNHLVRGNCSDERGRVGSVIRPFGNLFRARKGGKVKLFGDWERTIGVGGEAAGAVGCRRVARRGEKQPAVGFEG